MLKKVVLSYAVIITAVLLLLALVLWLNIYYSNEIIIKNNLINETQLIAAVMSDDYASFGSMDNKKYRLTIVNQEGGVLYDSYSDTSENHLNREEIESAINGTPKVVKRFSETLDKSMYYYAIKSQNKNGEAIIVRLALSDDTAQGYAAKMLPFYLLCLVILSCISIFFVRYVIKLMKRPLELVKHSLKELKEGNFERINIEGQDELASVIGEVNDINERLNDNFRRLSEEQTKLELVLNNIEQAVIALDTDDNISFINLAASNLFECKNVTGKGLVYAIEDRSLTEKLVYAAREGVTTYFDYAYKQRWLEITVTHTEKLADNINAIAFIKDMSKDKLAQIQRSDFFENASHELKTPLTSIRGFSEMLLAQTEDNSPQKKYIRRIYEESGKLTELLRDMLSLIEMSGDKARIYSSVDLKKVAEEIVSVQICEAEKKGVTLHIEGKGFAYAPVDEIYAVVENLVSNAIRYNKNNGSVTIKLQENEDYSIISVSDTGMGIPEQYRTRIFERFFMVDKSFSKRSGGTGLGLAIVKHIALNLKASLHLESKVGVGSVFTLEIPQKKDA